MRPLLPAHVLEAAEIRAERTGVGADHALIAAGALNEETYLRTLGSALGIGLEPLDGRHRAECPIDDARLIEAAKTGLLPLTVDDELVFVIAPRGASVRRITELVASSPNWTERLRFTTGERMIRFILRNAGKTFVAHASEQLRRQSPRLSAAPPLYRGFTAPVVATLLLTLVALWAAPEHSIVTFEVILGTFFIAWLGLRLLGAAFGAPKQKSLPPQSDAALPVYTVIAALYREAASIDGLLRSIERLDYPAEKLDVIFAIEADDHETRDAIANRKTLLPLTVITVPAGGPRTKPKALNVALPFARGTFSVIYDAEDRPEPDQLRRAVHAFRTGSPKLACVQARLCIDNTDDGWLARLFTAEYAGQFDVFLCGLSAMHLPLPLGGSSNHFRTDILRQVGGWDAYNVTEDADLGMRLARFGFQSEMIDTTTYEEAPARFGSWLRQRTRWFKGWMQTWLVHMREPHRLMRELGGRGFFTFQLIVGGNVLAALVHPVFMAGLIYAAAAGLPMWHTDDASAAVLAILYGSSAVIGYLTSAFLGWLGLRRRGLLSTAWVLLATPVHWLLLSLAAWRALWQLVSAPYVWEKTEHGLAKSSRRAAATTQSLFKLERLLTQLKESGDLPAFADETARHRTTRPGAARDAT